jgi:hypothetical protein
MIVGALVFRADCRHDRIVDDTQRVEPMYPKLAVDDAHRMVAHMHLQLSSRSATQNRYPRNHASPDVEIDDELVLRQAGDVESAARDHRTRRSVSSAKWRGLDRRLPFDVASLAQYEFVVDLDIGAGMVSRINACGSKENAASRRLTVDDTTLLDILVRAPAGAAISAADALAACRFVASLCAGRLPNASGRKPLRAAVWIISAPFSAIMIVGALMFRADCRHDRIVDDHAARRAHLPETRYRRRSSHGCPSCICSYRVVLLRRIVRAWHDHAPRHPVDDVIQWGAPRQRDLCCSAEFAPMLCHA